MPYITVSTEKSNEVKISYADYGEGKPVILLHGWPLSHRMWEKQITALTQAGYRVIAPDRRGFGESYKPWNGYDYDTFAKDINILITELNLHDVALIGFSMGGGEIARYIGTYGSERISKIVLMSAVTPYLLKSDDNPDGVDKSVFDNMLSGLMADRPAFLHQFTKNFVNWDTDGKEILSQESIQHAWDIAVWASPKAAIDCVTAFSSTDFRADLAKFDVPTLVMHGDADQIVPFEVSGQRTHEAIEGSELVVIAGGAHGITYTQPEKVNFALLEFLNK